MSTGAPSLGVDTHTHGHSRGHGHSRANRWVQPAPLPQPTEAHLHVTPEPVDTLGSKYSHQHTHHDSGHNNYTNAHSHSHGVAHHTHDHHSSAYRHHDEDQNSLGHDTKLSHGACGMLADANIEADRSPETNHELLTGALIVLPWIALSWYQRQCLQGKPPESENISGNILATSSVQATQKACLLTAITLVIFGSSQILRLYSSCRPPIKFPAMNLKNGQASICQVMSIGLPIFAALNIGGFLVAFALLLAVASGVPTLFGRETSTEERYGRKIVSITLLAVAVISSFLVLNNPWGSSPTLGYIALLGSVFCTPPPFPYLRHNGPIPEPGLVVPQARSSKDSSSVVVTSDASLAVVSGASLALLTILFTRDLAFNTSDLAFIMIPTSLFAASFMFCRPESLRSPMKFGLTICTGAAALLCSPHTQDDLFVVYSTRIMLTMAAFFASKRDDRHLHVGAHSHNHSHNHSHSHPHTTSKVTGISKFLLRQSESYPLLHSILKEKDSRSIFYFMCLNFTFMLVQLSYGFLTGSLGLLSDSIHMFFDCLALVVGLCAAVMSKWPPNSRFPYGYGKVDTLSGFANGIFLMIISVEIIYEAVERLSSGSEMHRIGELLAVSIAGLAVNLVGIFSFEHGHAHHGHDHDHDHGNENMHGIFLHILADTLGSVAVVISTILVHYSGWSGYDPLASCFIAILIFVSAIPLVSSTAKTLLLTLPADTEYNVRETLAGVSTLRGVVSYTVPKFWLDDTGAASSEHSHSHDHASHGTCGNGHGHAHSHSHSHSQHNDDHGHGHPHNHHDHHHSHDHSHDHEKKPQILFGVIHVIASRGADLEDVRQRTVDYLRDKNMDILVQVERDGDGRCWCCVGSKAF